MALIYDIGMHNGDDTDYYLTKGAEVVAVEADPLLCSLATERFEPFVKSGQLTIINTAVADQVGRATFYRHKEISEWNTLVAPAELDRWETIEVDTTPLDKLIRRDEGIEFLKIDIEGYDFSALDSLDRARIIPAHLSCEAHTVDIPCKLVAMGYIGTTGSSGPTATA